MIENSSAPLKSMIINLLQRESMSLADLQAATGTSLPTLRRAIQDLVDKDWVSTTGHDDATGGRPARLYGLNSSSHLVIGAHVEIPMVNLVVVDLTGTVLNQHQYCVSDTLAPDQAVTAISDFVEKVRVLYPGRRLLGIGMAAPGYVDAATGTILYVGRAPDWENYPMRARLEAALDLPVIMENDTDCLIRSELTNMNGLHMVDTIYLGVLEGVKVSMQLNGRIYSGAFGNAGLIGRTKICSQSYAAAAHNSRELEDVASVSGLCNEFSVRVSALDHVNEVVTNVQRIDDHKRKFYAILEAAENGDALCEQVVQQMIDGLAVAVTNLIYVLQPLVLIIGGALSNLPSGLSASLEKGIRSRLPKLLSNHLIISYASETGRFAAAASATRMFLQRYTTTDLAFL